MIENLKMRLDGTDITTECPSMDILTIEITGGRGVGKTTVALMIANFLGKHGFAIGFEGASKEHTAKLNEMFSEHEEIPKNLVAKGVTIVDNM